MVLLNANAVERGFLKSSVGILASKNQESRGLKILIFFLEHDESGKLYLDPYHAYYFQVHARLKFCSASYSDSVVCTEKELFVQRIFPEEPFISIVLGP
jgi:hypothetical protein